MRPARVNSLPLLSCPDWQLVNDPLVAPGYALVLSSGRPDVCLLGKVVIVVQPHGPPHQSTHQHSHSSRTGMSERARLTEPFRMLRILFLDPHFPAITRVHTQTLSLDMSRIMFGWKYT